MTHVQTLKLLAIEMRKNGISYREALEEFKRQYIIESLIANRGHQQKTAGEMDMHRNTLMRTMQELGVTIASVRPHFGRWKKKASDQCSVVSDQKPSHPAAIEGCA
jgi:transposase